MTETSTPARRFGRCNAERGCKSIIVDNGAPIEHPGIADVAGTLFCIEHHWPIRWSGVKAKLTAQECGAVCREGKRETCKCSCGGANHGMFA